MVVNCLRKRYRLLVLVTYHHLACKGNPGFLFLKPGISESPVFVVVTIGSTSVLVGTVVMNVHGFW